jgi:polysaccharide export outer membrane protein
MGGKTVVCVIGLVALVATGCMYTPEWTDIDQAMSRHKLRALEKRFEQFNGTYQIGIPDALQITVPDHPDLSGTYEVRPDGNITFMLLGDVYAEGLTPMQLSEVLAKRLEQFVKKVEVYVTVTGVYSKQIYVYDRTQTQNGRVLSFTGDMSVVDVLGQTSGWNRNVRAAKIRLIRDDPEKTKIFRIRGDRIVRGDLTTNVLLRENDMIYLPAHWGAEIAFAAELVGQPFRALVQGLGYIGEAPFEIARGPLEHAERRDRADD